MKTDIECPCGNKLAFSSCCLPVLLDHRKATTAEMLMRSRFTAFALHNTDHIRKSWHRKTRPNTVNSDHLVQWVSLEIHGCTGGQASDREGTVTFSCSYLRNGQFWKLMETSHFIKENGLWYYLTGEPRVTKETRARNSSCPCGSGLKFKRCCAK